MKAEKKMVSKSRISRAALKLIAGSSNTAAEPFGGDWPWCMGILNQPKHPRLMALEKDQAEKTE